ncbi:D-serine ammonia-lyase [Pichia kluyveri]|uniref:D-serine dehydratase n=1 Tax=Pichia kluyveri TaxID=36015 RepID=A0AAV5QZU7_PICKL|nr:D-serine ammonia-lyase [Pichia kluyveri]
MSFPYSLTPLADKETLLKQFKGKSKSELPTPGLVVDRKIFIENCEKMLKSASNLDFEFRAHVKTHKTLEGTILQLGSNNLKTDKIVVSTLMEAWNLIPLVEKNLINDVLFSLPVVKSKLPELSELSLKIPNLRLMLDNYQQINTLIEFSKLNNITKKWSIFVKVNMGTNRAGLKNDDEELDLIINSLLKNEENAKYVSLFGFYCHAGHAYSSCNCSDAENFLIDEIINGNIACKKAIAINPNLNLTISVGSTPTAHAAEFLKLNKLSNDEKIVGKIELHAGNYPFCDLQQISTNCVKIENVSCRVLADVLSIYPNRGDKKPGEELINAGVIALAREFGPLPGHGRIYSPKGYENWIVGRLSQEHGILTPLNENEDTKLIPIDTRVEIVPQHSCITAASYPWYYIVDGDDIVVDIWVPFRGW